MLMERAKSGAERSERGLGRLAGLLDGVGGKSQGKCLGLSSGQLGGPSRRSLSWGRKTDCGLQVPFCLRL